MPPILRAFFMLFAVLSPVAVWGQDAAYPLRPVHTFSIVARDPQTGDLGVAVQSHWFSVGSIVSWAEPGVGAIATQSFVEPSYGPLGLALLRAGKSAPDTLKALLAADAGREGRQVAVIDGQGNVAAWTGSRDIPAAGEQVGSADQAASTRESFMAAGSTYLLGKGYSSQANLMANDKVWGAMAHAYEQTKGDLADRLLAALDAAQGVGGDIRGRQSAALIVVSGKASDKPWERLFDVRVDDAAEPLKELRRLVILQRAYNHMNAGDAAVEHGDKEGALREYSTAEQLAVSTQGVLPSRLAEMIYWHAVALVNMARVDESLPLFKKVFAIDKNWATLTPRLSKVGLLPDNDKVIERIVEQAK